MATGLRARMQAGEVLAGTFLKTPAHELVEVLAGTGLDFLCLDAEHAPFDRGRADAVLAMARALGMPALVRIPWARPEWVQFALDAGAAGIVVPHVSDAETAAQVARAARFGPGGRGFAGSTRWADFGGQDMATLLARSAAETVVVAMIEEAAGVAAAEAIAATDGIDALMLGPADLSVALGETDPASAALAAAYDSVGRACAAAGKTFATWVPDAEAGAARHAAGVRMFFAASEHAWMRAGARAAAAALKAL